MKHSRSNRCCMSDPPPFLSPEQNPARVSEGSWWRRPGTLDGTLASSLNPGMLTRSESARPAAPSNSRALSVWWLATFLALVASAFGYLLLR